MALKFLNKKGWHTGSLWNIENVWKAEQKHDTQQKKFEELKKQIQDESQKTERRLRAWISQSRSWTSSLSLFLIAQGTTGIEPARGGFTIHCLDPLGYIRPTPTQVSVSIYDQIDNLKADSPFIR
ncbi:hypothetical protein LIER_32482 [Lithospermum erythrorhizon]|uniref:CBF1-interacting co-repressor CIR N-terminal domain-containing protein n=1 Tax=Lithospermum erythrorhizon TaxID=34254 RepID=A0AAV3RXL5_LITER